MRDNLLRRIDVYLKNCFARQTPPRVGEIAMLLGITRSLLTKKFRARYGMDLSEYFKHQQIARAKHLLEFTELRIGTIAWLAAFSDDHTFRRAFRRYTGMTPSTYRRTR